MKTIIIDGIEYEITPKIKFTEGDWVVIQETTYQIAEIGACNVTLTLNGRECTFDVNVLRDARLWDITKDAKDGDVLTHRGEQWIFIYKERKDETLIEYYALASEKGLTINCSALTAVLSCIVPATKEQRDTLERAMTNAGYRWDKEKLKLKKV